MTLGLGTGFGFTRAKDLTADSSQNGVGAEISMRLKLFRVLGAEVAMTPLGSRNDDGSDLVFDSKFRLSGLLYLVPLDVLGVYAKAGIGGQSFTDLVKLTDESNSYHAGGGLDVYVGDHVAIGAEFLVLLPGVDSVSKALIRKALTAEQSGPSNAGAPVNDPLAGVSMSDFVNARNFRASMNVRYYF